MQVFLQWYLQLYCYFHDSACMHVHVAIYSKTDNSVTCVWIYDQLYNFTACSNAHVLSYVYIQLTSLCMVMYSKLYVYIMFATRVIVG